MVNVNEIGSQIAVANLGGTVTIKHYNENIYSVNYKRSLNYLKNFR